MTHIEFASWGESLDYARKDPIALTGACSRADDLRRTKWAGGTWLKALDLAQNGWPEGEETVKALSEAFTDKISSLIERQVVTYDVEGIGLDVATFLNGEPECWQRFDTVIAENHGTRILRIVVNGFFSSGIHSSVIMRRGAIIASLISLLELANIRTELILHTPFITAGFGITVKTTLKTADQPLDLARLIFAVGHPANFRRISFSQYEQHPQTWEPGYGSPYDFPPKEQGDIYFGCMSFDATQWASDERAQEWLLKTIKEQGIIVK